MSQWDSRGFGKKGWHRCRCTVNKLSSLLCVLPWRKCPECFFKVNSQFPIFLKINVLYLIPKCVELASVQIAVKKKHFLCPTTWKKAISFSGWQMSSIHLHKEIVCSGSRLLQSLDQPKPIRDYFLLRSSVYDVLHSLMIVLFVVYPINGDSEWRVGNGNPTVWFAGTCGLYQEAGFVVIGITSGLLQACQSYEACSLLIGVNHHGNLCWPGVEQVKLAMRHQPVYDQHPLTSQFL